MRLKALFVSFPFLADIKIYYFMEVFNDKDPVKDEYGIAALFWPSGKFYGFITPEYSENRWPTKSTIIPQSFSTESGRKVVQINLSFSSACQKAKLITTKEKVSPVSLISYQIQKV